MTRLPNPADCSWLEADLYSNVLSDLADDLQNAMGDRPTKGWSAKHRWDGRSTVLSSIRYRAMQYRLRQGVLMEAAQ